MPNTEVEKSLFNARRRGRIHVIAHARIYGPYIEWRQIETWFIFGLGKNTVPRDDGRIIVGLMALRDEAQNSRNWKLIIMLNAAIVQIVDRIRAVKQELRRQIRRSVPTAPTVSI